MNIHSKFNITEFKNHNNDEFKVEVIVTNTLTTVIGETGAKVSVCSLQQAKKWKLTLKMFPSNMRLKPFNSNTIKVELLVQTQFLSSGIS